VTAQFLNKKTLFSFWVAGYGLTNVRLPNGSLLDDQPVKFLHKKTVSAMLSNPCEPQEPFGLNDSNFNCYKSCLKNNFSSANHNYIPDVYPLNL
jgi:hypothetical protein